MFLSEIVSLLDPGEASDPSSDAAAGAASVRHSATDLQQICQCGKTMLGDIVAKPPLSVAIVC